MTCLHFVVVDGESVLGSVVGFTFRKVVDVESVLGLVVGFTFRKRSTVNEPSFPSFISSISGFKESLTDGPNSSSTTAYTLPDLQVKNNFKHQ